MQQRRHREGHPSQLRTATLPSLSLTLKDWPPFAASFRRSHRGQGCPTLRGQRRWHGQCRLEPRSLRHGERTTFSQQGVRTELESVFQRHDSVGESLQVFPTSAAMTEPASNKESGDPRHRAEWRNEGKIFSIVEHKIPCRQRHSFPVGLADVVAGWRWV